MARPSSKDPLDKFRWSVSIDGFTRLGFTNCEVPSFTVNTNTYPEGGAHLTPRQIVDGINYKPVTLTRGVTSDRSFHEWAVGFFDITGFSFRLGRTETTGAGQTQYRRDVTIQHLDRAGRPVRTYVLYNAFPVEYKPASDFAADADDALSLETLVLAYEGFEVFTEGQENNPFETKDIVKRLLRRSF